MSNTTKRETLEIAIIVVAFFIAVPILFFVLPKNKPEGVWIDCTWAEISPDMPPKIKEECRKLRSKKLTTT
jgi:hypothetical protein